MGPAAGGLQAELTPGEQGLGLEAALAVLEVVQESGACVVGEEGKALTGTSSSRQGGAAGTRGMATCRGLAAAVDQLPKAPGHIDYDSQAGWLAAGRVQHGTKEEQQATGRRAPGYPGS